MWINRTKSNWVLEYHLLNSKIIILSSSSMSNQKNYFKLLYYQLLPQWMELAIDLFECMEYNHNSIKILVHNAAMRWYHGHLAELFEINKWNFCNELLRNTNGPFSFQSLWEFLFAVFKLNENKILHFKGIHLAMEFKRIWWSVLKLSILHLKSEFPISSFEEMMLLFIMPLSDQMEENRHFTRKWVQHKIPNNNTFHSTITIQRSQICKLRHNWYSVNVICCCWRVLYLMTSAFLFHFNFGRLNCSIQKVITSNFIVQLHNTTTLIFS